MNNKTLKRINKHLISKYLKGHRQALSFIHTHTHTYTFVRRNKKEGGPLDLF